MSRRVRLSEEGQMLDNEMPGAALEAPDTFQRLAAPLWPRLPLALGYSG